GRELGYRSDVDRLLERPGEELEAGLSPSLQSILLAEERVDVAWVSRVTGGHHPDTIRLVALFKRAGEGGVVDRSELAAIAGSQYHNDWAPRLARTVLSRLES
ncbi:MAG: hypothetical protein GY856_27355, partial [bacterium]|nr:hypothetical protein [bacterium]